MMKKMSVKERILNLAKQRFLKHGFYKLSMDRLVQELRTSKSSLYNHFSSKDDLVKAVVDELNKDINSNLEIILNDDKLSFKGKLIAVSEFTKSLLSKVSEDFLKDLEVNTPEIWNYYQETRINRINKYYRSLFELGINEGMIRADISMDVILVIYMNLMEVPLKEEYLELLNEKNQNIYEDTNEIFLNGILTN